MPNCDFYATGEDHRLVLDFVFSFSDCDVYELSSQPDQCVTKFESTDEVRDWHGMTSWSSDGGGPILLQIYPHAAKGRVVFEKREFSERYTGVGKFFYVTSGWGLIQLYLEPASKSGLRPSHTNHNSNKRASAWEETALSMGPVDEWDWKAVSSWSGRLNRFIRKCSVAKMHGRVVLPYAKTQIDNELGVLL